MTLDGWPTERAAVLRQALGVAAATGAYALSFGAISIASGLSVLQTCALSLLLFSGGSQFALVGVLGAGGGAFSAAATAVLLGSRNAFYGLRLATILDVTGLRRVAAAQLVIDETTAIATAQNVSTRCAVRVLDHRHRAVHTVEPRYAGGRTRRCRPPRSAPVRTGRGCAGRVPRVVGAAMRSREPWLIALVAAAVALAAVPYVPVGVPVLFAAMVAIGFGVRPGARTDSGPASDAEPDGLP